MIAIFRMTAILRKLVKWFYILFAIAAISLAVLVQAGRSFSHLLADYPQQISHYLSDQFNANVSIGSLKASWDGLKPMLDVDQLRITSKTGQPIIALAHAHLQLDLLDSLLNARLVWSSLTLRQVNIEFVQSVGGAWRIPGLPKLAEKNPDDELAQLDTLIDMLLLSQHIAFDQTQFTFKFASGDKTLLQSPSLLIENAGKFHRLSLQVDVDKHPKTLLLVVEAKGDPRHKKNFSSKAFLQLNQFPTNEPIAAITAFLLRGIHAEVHSEGKLDAKFWFKSLPQSESFEVVGQVGLQRLSVPILGRELVMDSFSTDVIGHWFYSGQWQLALQNIGATMNQQHIEKVNLAASVNGPDAPVVFRMQKLNLQRLNQALDSAGVLGDARLRDVMRTLDPRGEMHNLEVTVPTQKLSDWQIQANLVKFANNAWQGVPALAKVDGFIQAGQRGGHVDIDSRDGFSMHYYPTYTSTMDFDQAHGQVAWWLQPENNQIYVNSGALEFSKAAEKAKGYMWLALPWKQGTGDVDLYLDIGASQLSAGLYRKYVPAVVPQSLLTWLENSIGSENPGIVTQGGFVYRGTLNTPNHAARSHQLYLDVEHAKLRYHPDWPALDDVNGRLLVDGVNVTASVDSAKLFSSDVAQAEISVRPNPLGAGALLSVKGEVSGAASDGLRVLRESMLRQFIGANMDSWKLEGSMITQVNIAVPLEREAPGAAQQIDIDLNAPFFEMGNLKLSIRDIGGQISFNQDTGLSSQKMQAKLFNEPVEVLLSTKKQTNFSQTIVNVTGELEGKSLAQWSQRPEALFLKGKIPYVAQVELNHRSQIKAVSGVLMNHAAVQLTPPSKAFAVVTVSSQLPGVVVNLPAPYGKSSDSERSLIFRMSLFEKSSLIDVRYGDNVQALLELESHNNNKLRNANIALGNSAKLSEEPQFLLSGQLPTLDIEPWKKVVQQYLDYSQQLNQGSIKNIQSSYQFDEPVSDVLVAGLPFHAAIILEHYQVGPLLLENIETHTERLPDAWKVQFANSIAVGDVYLPIKKNKPMQIDLKNLHLSNNIIDGKSVSPSADTSVGLQNSHEFSVINKKREISIDPRSLPFANITVRELYVDDDNYGSWSLQIRPNEEGVLFDNIHGKVRGITVSGADDSLAGAKLHWLLSDKGSKTNFIGALSATDISSVLLQWKKPDTIESSAAQVRADVGWVGDPQDFALKKLSGNMDIFLEKGRFKRNPSAGSDGFLRLMAILNFDSLARRLRLDFSDLYQSGLAYDQISGKVNFTPGTMTFAEPLEVKTPSSRLQLAGKLDLEHEKINARLVATLPIAGNFTFFTALVGGLPAAAGVYLVSKLFKKQVDQATSVSYSIHGGWDDPQMNFDRLFESEESLRESVNRKETPKKIKSTKKTKVRPKNKPVALPEVVP